jgi:hypothetical protein
MERERDRDMAAPSIYERLRGKGYLWKRVNERYKNGQPKVSPDSFQYRIGRRWMLEERDIRSFMASVQVGAA